jgi:transposase-like protein
MSEPMKCPMCSATMNHHADKLMYTDRGEQLEEFYQCPDCGKSAARESEQQMREA